ncbi:biotin--[acetyl-CoA-carboxylase] ligase [Oenococcus alcoholitolerans]|uniref:Bifunctional ligase/repressor BirA n=1 Tax=Oenococcus alcoholitolerans TaxID=931074 RepID=A0ABR4XRZ6_9LACO|nr:hypothetical protein Q757_04055 [Oenococcus alcoholitolerans]
MKENSNKNKLKDFLSANPQKWYSGNDLAQALAISRTAIWKLIKQLSQEGLEIQSRHHLGYRLLLSDHLNKTWIAKKIKKDLPPSRLFIFPTIDSTNIFAKREISEHNDRIVIVIADRQTEGHGRFQRKFYSPAKSGLYLSIAIPLKGDQTVSAGLLTTATAVAVGRSIKEVFGVQLDYKWVNDLYLSERKVGGILTEAITDFESNSISSLVVGIGLNLSLDQNELPIDLRDKIAGIAENGQEKRNQIAAAVINNFFKLFKNYQDGRFLDEYRKNSFLIGRKIQAHSGQRTVAGTAIAIDDQGSLIILEENKKIKIQSGEVTKVDF